jgi:hypothetical protein
MVNHATAIISSSLRADIETAGTMKAAGNTLGSFFPVYCVIVRTHFQVKLYQLIFLRIRKV